MASKVHRYSELDITIGGRRVEKPDFKIPPHPDELLEKRFGWPECAICKKPVDAIHTARDMLKNQLIVVAECHGETEESFINNDELLDSRGSGMHFGKAFVDKTALGGAALAKRRP